MTTAAEFGVWTLGVWTLFWIGQHVSLGTVSLLSGSVWAVPLVAIQCIVPIVGGVFVFLGWWPSMRLASALVRDDIGEVIQAVGITDPREVEAWTELVARPALALKARLRDLSAGWGGGLQGCVLTCWTGGMGFFALALNTPLCEAIEDRVQAGEIEDLDGPDIHTCDYQRTIGLFLAAISALVPLGLLADVAATSSRCDLLMSALNHARARHLYTGPLLPQRA
eukprot:COSAG01_NODE_792_length_13554_cov_13.811891_14_plen_224_part_00